MADKNSNSIVLRWNRKKRGWHKLCLKNLLLKIHLLSVNGESLVQCRRHIIVTSILFVVWCRRNNCRDCYSVDTVAKPLQIASQSEPIRPLTWHSTDFQLPLVGTLLLSSIKFTHQAFETMETYMILDCRVSFLEGNTSLATLFYFTTANILIVL